MRFQSIDNPATVAESIDSFEAWFMRVLSVLAAVALALPAVISSSAEQIVFPGYSLIERSFFGWSVILSLLLAVVLNLSKLSPALREVMTSLMGLTALICYSAGWWTAADRLSLDGYRGVTVGIGFGLTCFLCLLMTAIPIGFARKDSYGADDPAHVCPKPWPLRILSAFTVAALFLPAAYGYDGGVLVYQNHLHYTGSLCGMLTLLAVLYGGLLNSFSLPARIRNAGTSLLGFTAVICYILAYRAEKHFLLKIGLPVFRYGPGFYALILLCLSLAFFPLLSRAVSLVPIGRLTRSAQK